MKHINMNYTIKANLHDIPVFKSDMGMFVFCMPAVDVMAAWGVDLNSLLTASYIQDIEKKNIQMTGMIPVYVLDLVSLDVFNTEQVMSYFIWAKEMKARSFQANKLIKTFSYRNAATLTPANRQAYLYRFTDGMNCNMADNLVRKTYPEYMNIDRDALEITLQWYRCKEVLSWINQSMSESWNAVFPLNVALIH